MHSFSLAYSTHELLEFKEVFDRFSKDLPDTFEGGRELLYFIFDNPIAISVFNKIDSKTVDILCDDYFSEQKDEADSGRFDEIYGSDWDSWCDGFMNRIDQGEHFDNMDAGKLSYWTRCSDPFSSFYEPQTLIDDFQRVLCGLIANSESDMHNLLTELSYMESIDAPLQIAVFGRLVKRIEQLERRVEELENGK